MSIIAFSKQVLIRGVPAKIYNTVAIMKVMASKLLVTKFKIYKSQNQRIFRVGRNLWRSCRPKPLPRWGHPEQVTQDGRDPGQSVLRGPDSAEVPEILSNISHSVIHSFKAQRNSDIHNKYLTAQSHKVVSEPKKSNSVIFII